MKTLKSFFFLLFITVSSSLFAQSQQAHKTTDTVKVWGNCGMCQSKIEKAAKAAGAASAKWDVDSKILFVSYNQENVSTEKIEKAVAAVGYDTEHQTATDKAYNKLPGCCQYDRKGASTKD